VKTIEPAFDLNSLRVVVALAKTRSVSRAAEALGMSQSGFSTALARLRRQFGDQLFVRTRHGMEATERAAAIAEAAHEVMEQVQERILQRPVFRPETERIEFRLSMPDLAEVVFLPRLVAHLRKAAPRATISSNSMPPEPLRLAMEAGQVDLALGYFPDLELNGFFRQRLYIHSYACVLRNGHAAARNLTAERYAKLHHAVVASPARTNDLFERFLEKRGIHRDVAVRIPHYLSLPSIVAESDLVATVPVATAQYFAELGVATMVGLPFKPPAFAVQQHWHRRTHQDPRMAWLRKQIHLLFNDQTDRWRATEVAFYGDIRGKRGKLAEQ
jgi:DNA-binding transcriptional LysR family regulator